MGSIVAFVISVVLLIAGAIGWVMNIVALIHIAGAGITGMFVLRIIGIFFAPLGAILGYVQ